MNGYELDFESALSASREAVWRHITSWEGVNRELWPFNMTHPGTYPSVVDVPADGQVHFVSKIRLGVLPLDLHRLSMRSRVDGEYFDECSSNLLLREWHHRRTLEVQDDRVVVRDACILVPRFRVMGGLLAALYRWIFRRRHARLRETFASVA